MQRVLSLFIIFSLVLSLCAGEYKIVLSSHPTFDDAKNNLRELGLHVGEKEKALMQAHHFEILARPSGKAFIVVLEPLNNEQTAHIVLNHFKHYSPDAYVGDYFGYTQGSVVLETKLKFEKEASVVVQSEKKLPVEVNARVNVCKTSGFGYTFVFLVLGIVIILGWIFVYRLRKKEKKKSASIAMHASMLIPTPMDLVSVNAWRYEEALKRSGDDSTLLNSRIDSFIQNLPHMLFELKKLRTSGDFVNLILQAHLLKSSSAGIAAHSLRIACKNLEISAREKSSLLVEKNFTKVESMAKETLALLKEHRGKNRTEIKSPQDVTVSLDEQLTIIEQKIQQNIFVDTEAFSLFKETLGEGLAITVKEFKQRIDKLEYEKALEQLGLIRGELI